MLQRIVMNQVQTEVPLLSCSFSNANNHQGSIALGVSD